MSSRKSSIISITSETLQLSRRMNQDWSVPVGLMDVELGLLSCVSTLVPPPPHWKWAAAA
jgi:hypothetical protein